MIRAPSVGAFLPLHSAATASESPCYYLFLFFMERLEAPSLVSSSCLALPWGWSKIAPTASSPKAWLVAMSRSSLVVLRCLCPSLWTRDSQVVPDRKAPMTSASATLGSSLRCLEM
jgi:hypothetical protein